MVSVPALPLARANVDAPEEVMVTEAGDVPDTASRLQGVVEPTVQVRVPSVTVVVAIRGSASKVISNSFFMINYKLQLAN